MVGVMNRISILLFLAVSLKAGEVNAPRGDHELLCDSCSYNQRTDTLSCTCPTLANRKVASYLSNVLDCTHPVRLRGGKLMCGKHKDPESLPRGNYLETCSSCQFVRTRQGGEQLTCTCIDEQGIPKHSMLKSPRSFELLCEPASVENVNGALQCIRRSHVIV